jgi:hypothetical protein
MTLSFPDLVDEMQRSHHAHTIILYGSRARGDATHDSDVDIACFADVAEVYRDARLWSAYYLDAFIYPTASLHAPSVDDMLKLCGGKVLLDARNLADALLSSLSMHLHKPVAPLAKSEIQMRSVWANKMLARIARGDIEANYRRHWLLFQLLEDCYAIAELRYPGPKLAFADLASRAPATRDAFQRALAPDASHQSICDLVAHLESLALMQQSASTGTSG